MDQQKNIYETPLTSVIRVRMEAGMLQASLDANRIDYGDAITDEWI